MNIQNLPVGFHHRLFFFFKGIEFPICRQISKFFKKFIDEHENSFFYDCMQNEKSNQFHAYNVIERIDWKELYQIEVTNDSVARFSTKINLVLQECEKRNNAVKILSVVDSVISFTSITLSLSKVFGLGARATREAIKELMKKNPGMTWSEASSIICPNLSNNQIGTFE